MNRRAFMWAVGAAFVVACNGGGEQAGLQLPFDDAQTEALRALGEAVLKTKKVPQTKAELHAALMKHIGVSDGAGAAAVHEALVARSQKDFANGQLVSAHRWVLSKTEALVAASVAAPNIA